MSFHIVEEKRKNGVLLVVRTTYRNELGKSTSANCGVLGTVEEFKKLYGDQYKDEALILGKAIYDKWKRDNANKFVCTFVADEDETEDNVFYSSQLYLRSIWNQLGLPKFLSNIKKESKGKWKYDLNEVVFFLTSAQILNSSTSKLSAFNSSCNYLFKPDNLTIDSLYDCLDVLSKNIDYINNYTYKKVKKYLEKKSDLYFYDVTTINMSQSVNENTLIGIKKGKEGIYGPLIQIGCVCDQWGLLVGLYIFNGRESEQNSLKEQVELIFKSDKCKNVVICTDAGLCSAKNKRYLENKFKGYIMTQSLSHKKVPDFIREWAIDTKFDGINMTKEEIIATYEELLKDESKEGKKIAEAFFNRVFYKSRWAITEAKIYADKNKKEETTFKSILIKKKDDSCDLSALKESDFSVPKSKKYIKITYNQRLVVSFSLKYYYSQLKKLEEDRAKAENAVINNYDISSKSTKDYRRFVSSKKVTQDGELAEEIANEFLEEKYEFEKSLCGLYCQATNLEDDSKDIYRYSRNRWQIEYAFRTAKTFQGFGTVYLHKIEHIIGHFELCFLSQELLKALVYKVYKHIGYEDCMLGRRNSNSSKYNEDDFTLDKIINELSYLKSVKMIDDNGREIAKSLAKKDAINTVLAEVFNLSVTKKAKLLKEMIDAIK